MKEMLVLEEEKGNKLQELLEKAVQAATVVGFRLLFLDNNGNKAIRRVEVRNLNFQDLMRHLQRGESVLITPKLLENPLKHAKNQKDRPPWYFVRT